jgi:hypothetical protein
MFKALELSLECRKCFMRLPETCIEDVGANHTCHVHVLAILVGAVRELGDRMLHEREA